MLKSISHIILSIVLLISFTGVSTANLVCKGLSMGKMEIKDMSCATNESCHTDTDCCTFTKELKKLDIDLSDERDVIAVPDIDFLTVTYFDAFLESHIVALNLENSELLYKIPLHIRDIPVLNQNFRI